MQKLDEMIKEIYDEKKTEKNPPKYVKTIEKYLKTRT